jgi:hypothetical protein
MTGVNLHWPRWAELAAHLHWKTAEARGVRAIWLVRKAGAALANRYGREQDARFARLAWEELRASQRPRELWARPPHRIRYIRYFLGLALAFGLGELPATAAAERDDARAATAAPSDEQVEPGRLYQALGWAAFGGSAGDVLSTEYALAAGGYELNPLQQRRAVRIGSNAAFPFATNSLTEELRKDGHPKLALWCRVAVVALKGYAIVHNLRVAR